MVSYLVPPALGFLGQLPLGVMSRTGFFRDCYDLSNFYAYQLRALGVPCAVDFVPIYGDYANGHSWVSMATPAGMRPYDIGPSPHFYRWQHLNRPAKIYRITSLPQADRVRLQQTEGSVSPLLRDTRIRDVTHEYTTLAQCDLTVPVAPTVRMDQVVYLCVFSADQLQAIDYAQAKNGAVSFAHVGTDVAYLLCTYDTTGYQAVSSVYIANADSTLTPLNPTADTRQVRLTRKFFTHRRTLPWRRNLLGARVQGANRADFSDAVDLHTIVRTPSMRSEEVVLLNAQPYRYLRWVSSEAERTDLADLAFFDTQGRSLSGDTLFGSDYPGQSYRSVFDADPLSFASGCRLSVGLDLGPGPHPRLGKVRYRSRNDDNHVRIGDTYELLYWHNQWVSLGQQRAQDTVLYYEQVPHQALLLLKNHTRGREERPFIYQKGIQYWY